MDSAIEMLSYEIFHVGQNMNSSSFVGLNISVQRNNCPKHDLTYSMEHSPS